MPHAILNIHHGNTDGAYYVGRPSPLGNPFVIGKDGDRDAVIAMYKEYLDTAVASRDPAICTALLGIQEDQAIACFCAPKPCHVEVIVDQLDSGVQDVLRKKNPHSMRYAGIGSRTTPQHVLIRMSKAAHRLSELGYTLLSGGAGGADSAFEDGCFGKKEVYLPWPGFRSLNGRHCVNLPSEDAFRVASAVHPAWLKLNRTAQSLMARNSHQVLGHDLRSPVDFVLCWTPDGCEHESDRSRTTGGTGQAIALADRWGIPVFNMFHTDALNRLAEWLNTST